MLTTWSLCLSPPPSRDKSLYLDCPAYVSKAGLGLWILSLYLLSAWMTGMGHQGQTSQTFLSVLVCVPISFCKTLVKLGQGLWEAVWVTGSGKGPGDEA